MSQFCRKWFRIFTEETRGNGAISGGTTKVTDDVPNFKIFNEAAIALAGEETRIAFVKELSGTRSILV